tara:strand:+ start:219 stop:398 length:180 start_codon:yes stop_codon:yes gene_type:complete
VKEDYITIKFETFKSLVDVLEKHIFDNDPDADLATHPFEIRFLDYMRELQYRHKMRVKE